MFDSKETTAIVFADGFNGIAVTGMSETHADLIQYLNDESVWEVFDELSTKVRGEYKVTIRFWWESNFPEQGGEFVTEIINAELITQN
tara:strand:+ start:570 stop:833 length:264 start_codon:yes stop_codon:yes gene_type:complete